MIEQINQNALASPEQIFEMVNKIIQKVHQRKASDQRISQRFPIQLPVSIQYVSDKLEPVGERVLGVTKDVSVGGVGLLATDEIQTGQAIVSFHSMGKETPPVLVEFSYCSSIGPFYQFGGAFRADWSEISES